MLSLKMHYEPPFNTLIKKLDEILKVEKDNMGMNSMNSFGTKTKRTSFINN